MEIKFLCGKCGQTLKVEDRHAGAKVRCPKCGTITAAPSIEQPVTPNEPTSEKKVKASTALDLDSFEEIEPISFTKKNDGDNDMDMTPMVDVTFLLLIFFMVTAAFNLQKSLEVPTPIEDAAARQEVTEDIEEGNIIVRIDRDSTVWVDDSEAPSEQDLLVKLREAKHGVPGSDSPPINSMLVQADGDARHEVVIMVLDAGNSVEMEPIRLVTVDEDDF
jgi:biopolymer transport protein ExbD